MGASSLFGDVESELLSHESLRRNVICVNEFVPILFSWSEESSGVLGWPPESPPHGFQLRGDGILVPPRESIFCHLSRDLAERPEAISS